MGIDTSRWQGVGSPPISGGSSPFPCPECGVSRWVEIGGGFAADVYHPNIDIVPAPGVDIVCDLEEDNLPFHDGHATAIKAIHSLQHLSRDGARHVLEESYRILCPGGTFYAMLSDFVFLVERLREDGIVEAWLSGVYHGFHGRDGSSFHKWGYSFETAKAEFERVGFVDVRHLGFYNRWEFKMDARKR